MRLTCATPPHTHTLQSYDWLISWNTRVMCAYLPLSLSGSSWAWWTLLISHISCGPYWVRMSCKLCTYNTASLCAMCYLLACRVETDRKTMMKQQPEGLRLGRIAWLAEMNHRIRMAEKCFPDVESDITWNQCSILLTLFMVLARCHFYATITATHLARVWGVTLGRGKSPNIGRWWNNH